MRHPINIFSLVLVCCILVLPLMAAAAEPQSRRVEVYPSPVTVSVPETVGDGTAFPCSFKASGLASVTVTFLKSSITAPADKNGEAVVLLPVPLDQPDTDAPLTWKASFTAALGAYAMPASGTATVKIRERSYPVQKLTVAPKYVTPDPELQERIEQERKLMGAALNTRSGTRHWSLPMARPVPGRITSLYGLRRVLNGQPRSAHKGLDFRGAEGSPITAIADGTVVLAGDFYYAGKFVVLDHGLGVVSISMHMSEVIARQGQAVKTGETIGLVGSTGRSTGPHLHLGVSVLGQSIDALTLLRLTEEDKAVYAAMMQSASEAPPQKTVKKTGGSAKKKSAPAPIKKSGKKADQKTAGKPAARSTQTGTGSTGPKQGTQ
ncbi:Peptidase M23 [uncultured delta proteobacterium]|uniref:Peptidase M23 n=1 Tax=uncultured delta proteobacterium TaxID=34034 RepID=A0A212J025_9DELT|nr:Peptidase M23 [uncultured delta proteobacterium]